VVFTDWLSMTPADGEASRPMAARAAIMRGLCMAIFLIMMAPGAWAACDGGAFDQFDFWVGEWTVHPVGKPDSVAGRNRISRIDGGCAVLERWTSAGGSTGSSLNFYNPVSEQWRQIWVADQGYSIDIAGGWTDGAMRLTGEITYYDGRKARFRGVWTPMDDGRVRQTFHQHDGEAWQLWFDGMYVPVAP